MMLRASLASAGIALLFLATPALAQSSGQPVRIQSSTSFFVPSPSGDGEEAQKLRDRARRTVYEMAAHECDLVREVLARDCRIESMNININNVSRQFGSQQPEGFSVNASLGLQITLK